ncbi:MAG: S41 family peptidase [Bdellovibrionia bacterium]
MLWQQPSMAYARVCALVAERIYLEKEIVQEWKRVCDQKSEQFKMWTPVGVIGEDLKQTLQLLPVSHLEFYWPQEAAKVWEGQSKATGIRSEYWGEHLIVTEIEKQSPASRANLREGDLIISHNQNTPHQLDVYVEGGNFQIKNPAGKRDVVIPSEAYSVDRSPVLETISADLVYLKIPSFHASAYFSKPLSDLLAQVTPTAELLVDLRGNSGGNFFAGLDFLSHFFCEPRTIGSFFKKSNSGEVLEFPLVSKDKVHIDFLKRARQLKLNTFRKEKCLNNRLIVLIDHKTASVSEMVANAFRETQRGKLVGGTSAGKLLVALWYDLNFLGPGVRLSIPEALFLSETGVNIERQGVPVDLLLPERFEVLFQKGKTPWLQQVYQDVQRQIALDKESKTGPK